MRFSDTLDHNHKKIIQEMFIMIPGFIPAYEKVWFFGDAFMFAMFEQNYKLQMDEMKTYVRDHFDVAGYMNNNYNSLDHNVPSRMRNLMVQAQKEQILLPKIIVVVPDSDILDYCMTKNVNEKIPTVIDWIMRQYDKLVETHKEFLPNRAKKTKLPPFCVDRGAIA